MGAASQPTGLQVARHGCLAARIIDCGCCCLAARLTAAKRPKVVFIARAAGLRHVRRLQATLHRSTCLYMGAGCLQSDGQTNAKVTAMQLLLKREDRGVLKIEFLCLRANLVLQSMWMDTSYLLQLFGE